MTQKYYNWITKNIGKFPPFLNGKINSWTEYSIRVRLPEIAERILAENVFPLDIQKKLLLLQSEIPEGPIRMINGENDYDSIAWQKICRPYIGLDWLEIPWFFAEFYFYRRVLEAIGYFNPGKYYQYDPYQYQKSESLAPSIQSISKALQKMEEMKRKGHPPIVILSELIYMNLIGNRQDLSLWPINSQRQTMEPDGFLNDNMIIDDTQVFIDWFSKNELRNVDILIDNAGFEFISDLVVADFFLHEIGIKQITLHLKPYPIFVSDALEKDVRDTLDYLIACNQDIHLSAVALRINKALRENRVILKSDLFWGLPLAMWEMPQPLLEDFSNSDLVISKGDANYRRLLGDFNWELDKNFCKVLEYFPTSILILRVLKSEIGVGYSKKRIDAIEQSDRDWMKSGRWGSIQFFDGKHGH